MIKESSQKVLLALYAPDQPRPFVLSPAVFKELLQLSESGFRSLLFSLEKKQFILSTSLGEPAVQLLPLGQQALTDLFPALRSDFESWQGDWQALVFLEAPTGDQNFRNLRRKLLELKAIPLTRGVYLYPGPVPALFRSELQVLYAQSVAILSVSQWQFGSNPAIEVTHQNAEETFHMYSSVSTTLYELLTRKNHKKGLTLAEKNRLFSAFTMFWESIGLDMGFLGYYYPRKLSLLDVLKQFQEAFLLIHESNIPD